MLYDTTRQIIRSYEPHASTDTFFRETNGSALARTPTGKYTSTWYVIGSTEPRVQAVTTAAAAAAVQTPGILTFREIVPLYVLILVYQCVISSTEPRAKAVSTAAAAVLLVHVVRI